MTIPDGLAFDEEDCRRVIAEGWGRFSGQPSTMTVNQNWRSPGLFGMIQRRRQHLFKLPDADPVLPVEMGEYPHFQSDFLRQKHWELVARLLENRFVFQATSAPNTSKARETADKAEWVLTYIAAAIQENTGVDWQRALAEGASAYCYGVIHWRIAPELASPTPDAKYLDALPGDETDSNYRLTSESIDGDTSQGKYRETAASVTSRDAIAKSRGRVPIHVEIVAPDQVAFIDDESDEPGPGAVIHIKEVGIVDYNGQLAKDGLRLLTTAGADPGSVKLTLEEFAPGSGVQLERPAPVGISMPSVAGWKQRLAIATITTRKEFYELVSTTLLTGGSETIVNQAAWVLVKAGPHGYGRCNYERAYATVEENEFDPALRYRPALDGIYASKSSFDYTRALHDQISTRRGVQEYFIKQDVNAPPTLAGDEEGDQVNLTRDSAQAQVMPPGQDIKAIERPPLDPAFVKMLELQTEELKDSAPPTGQTPISATSQPWNLRIGQVMANAYPALLLNNVGQCIVTMMRNIIDVAAKPAEEGGLGVPLVAPGFSHGSRGVRQVNRSADAVVMNPEDWEGIWLDISISPISSAERVTQIQMGQQLLNNPVHVTTPEMFVSDDLGVQDATGHMKEVDAYWAIQPFMQGLTHQALSEYYGKKALVGADGSMANGLGQPVDPNAVLAQNGVTPSQPAAPVPGQAPMPAGPPGMEPPGAAANLPSPTMPGLPTLRGSGAPSLPGMV